MNKYCNDFHNGENIIFCKIDNILSEFETIKEYNRNVILIISSGDYTFTHEHLKKCPTNVKLIFSTNTNIIDDKVIPIPTGVENELLPSRNGHGMINNEIFDKLEYLKYNDVDSISNHNRVYANFSTPSYGCHLYSSFPGYRSIVKHQCESSEFIDFESNIGISEYFNKVIQYPASISPTGNGLECIRTWEIMYMNRIPIVIGLGNNSHSAIYENIYKHLPLVFIEDVNTLSNKDYIFDQIEKSYTKPRSKLDYNYWKQFITDHIKKENL